MTVRVGPHSLDLTRVVFGPGGAATLKAVSPAFYQELDAEFQGFRDHVLIQVFRFDEAWPSWEVHPQGDEFVYLLSGDTDLLLRTDDGERSVRVSEPGSYVVVPRGTWHTARPHEATAMLFVTPGEGTLNAGTPGG